MNFLNKIFLFALSLACCINSTVNSSLKKRRRSDDREQSQIRYRASSPKTLEEEQDDFAYAIRLSLEEEKRAKLEEEEKCEGADEELKKILALSEKSAQEEAEQQKNAQEALQKQIFESQRSFARQIAKSNNLEDITALMERLRGCFNCGYTEVNLSNLQLIDVGFIKQALIQKNTQSLILSGNNFANFTFDHQTTGIKRISLSDNENLTTIFFDQDGKTLLRAEDKPTIDFRNTPLFNDDNIHRLPNLAVLKKLQNRGYKIFSDIPQNTECCICLDEKECALLECCGSALCQECYQAEQARSEDCATCTKKRGNLIF